VGPKILGQATTKLFEGVMAKLPGRARALTSTYIGRILLSWWASTCWRRCSLRAGLDYGRRFGQRSPTASARTSPRRSTACRCEYFDGTNHGEVLSRVTNDVDTINQTLNQSLSQIITSGDRGRRAGDDADHQLADDPGGLLIIPLSLVVIVQMVSSARRSISKSSRTTWATSTGTSKRCTAGTW
jgi:ABC-type multidrug transport system fused ATPase/permease subunit